MFQTPRYLEHESAELAASKVLRNAQSAPLPPGTMRAVLDCIAPAGIYGRREYVLALLEYRVTWPAVRHWIADRHKPPQWARDILKEKLAAQINERRALQEKLG